MSGDGNGTLAPFRVAEDASRITVEGEPANWGNDAKLTVLPRMQTAIVVNSDDSTWKYNGSQWLPFAKEKLSTIAYPG